MRTPTPLAIGLIAAFFSIAQLSAVATSVLSYHNDTVSSGVNSTETVLTPGGLTVNTFARSFSTTVDGEVYAQPLYVPGVVVRGGSEAGTHNLVFVATQHDSLYAIDASTGTVVWKTSFLTNGLAGATSITTVPQADTLSTDITPEIGICSTPVIDPSTDDLYVTAKTKQIVNGATGTPNYVYTLYKIDITNGNATANANIVSKTIIGDTSYDGTNYTFRTNTDPTATQDPFVGGTGDGAIVVGGQSRVYFNALRQMNRSGLLLYNGTIYIAFGSHGDNDPYHGWVLGYNESTLAVTAVLNLTPNGGMGGIWQSGGIPTVDSSGNIFLMTGNGTFDGSNANGVVTGLDSNGFPASGDYGDCIVKISPDATTSVSNQNINGWGLKVADYFSPYDNLTLDQGDVDQGSGGCILLPDSAGSSTYPHLLVGTGKQGTVFLVNRDSMGGFSATTDNVVQSDVPIDGSFDTPAFFNGVLYYAGVNEELKGFAISNAQMSTTPTQGTVTYSWPGATPSISANGTGNGIVWTVNYSLNELMAYSVDNFGDPIWTSALAPNSRDALGSATKFSTPAIADGRVMVGTQNSLVVYAMTSLTASDTPPVVTTSVASSIEANSATVSGVVNPKGTATSVYFQYGTSTAYGATTTGQSEGSGTANVSFTAGLPGLISHTVYHYQAVATYASGATVYGADKTFTTLPAPVIESTQAAYPGGPGAEVSQSIDPNGELTTVYFQYGTSTAYGSQTTSQSAGRGLAAVNINALLPGLTPDTVYHYRVVTVSAAGTFYGPDETFTSLPFSTNLVGQKTGTATGLSGATFSAFGNPALNANDHVAFKATVTGSVTIRNDVGIWADDNTGTLQLVAQTGNGVAPGTSTTFSGFSDPVYNGNDNVAFLGTLTIGAGATIRTTVGLWSNSSGALSLVAREGSAAPGTGGNFASFTALGLSDSAGAVFYATLSGTAANDITPSSNAGIWEGNSTADLSLILRQGQTVGDKTISKLTFQPADLYVTGQTRSFAASGDIVCGATFSDKSTGIVDVVGGTPNLIAASATSATGVTNATFASFGVPIINDSDDIAFAAKLSGGGVTTSSNAGIWTDIGGTLGLVTQTGTTAPDTLASFASFSDPVLNNNAAIAFRGTLKVATGEATLATETGVWCNSAGSLALVARQGEQAPGCPTGATFANFSEIYLPDQGGATNNGGVVFLGTLNASAAAGVNLYNYVGIWAVDSTGALQLVVRTGDILGGKTVTGLTFLPSETYVTGQSRSVAQETGDLVYLVTFSDRTTAIYDVVFP